MQVNMLSKNNLTLKEAILDLGYLTSEEFDLYVQPEKNDS